MRTILTTLLMIGLVIPAVAEDKKWIQFNYPPGNFSIEMPGRPTKKRKIALHQEGQIDTYIFIYNEMDYNTYLRTYYISYSDLPKEMLKSKSARQILYDALRGGLDVFSKPQVFFVKRIRYGSHPGIKTHVQGYLNNGQTKVVWYGAYLLVKNRLYQIFIYSLQEQENLKIFERFIGSFSLINDI